IALSLVPTAPPLVASMPAHATHTIRARHRAPEPQVAGARTGSPATRLARAARASQATAARDRLGLSMIAVRHRPVRVDRPRGRTPGLHDPRPGVTPHETRPVA